MTTELTTLLFGAGMAALGNITHILKRVVEARAAGDPITIRRYVKANPYRVALGIASTAALMGLLIELDQITAMGAFAAGYMADSGLAILSARTQRSLS